MKKSSTYLSDKFNTFIWPAFKNKLKNNHSKENYYSIICMICEDAKKDFLELEYKYVKSYFDSLTDATKIKQKKLSEKTIQSKLSALRSVASYIEKNKELYEVPNYDNVFRFIENPKNNDVYFKKEDIPSQNELLKLLTISTDNMMAHLIFAMVIKCGFTASEICDMKLSQIYEDAAGRFCVKFTEKDGTRYVKLPEDVVLILLEYKKTIPDSSIYLFYNKWKKKLQIRSLETLVNKYVKEADLTKNYTIKDLRNAAINMMLKAGADQTSVASYVGVDGRWLYRFDNVVKELDSQPVDKVKFKIL